MYIHISPGAIASIVIAVIIGKDFPAYCILQPHPKTPVMITLPKSVVRY